MNDNKGFLLQDIESSKESEPTPDVDRKLDKRFISAKKLRDTQEAQQSERMENLTYVSSRGYFFQ